MNFPSSPIGIFDSGIGGTTVLKALRLALPQENFIYLADSARLPYGDKTPENIIKFTRQKIEWLTEKNVKLIIMACGTSSALAYDVVSQDCSIPLIDLINPTASATAPNYSHIGVFATPATIQSQAYSTAFKKVNSQILISSVACPELVGLIEQNLLNDSNTYDVLQKYLDPLFKNSIQALVYGCTHYPYLSPDIKILLKNYSLKCDLINPAQYVTQATVKLLSDTHLLNEDNPHPFVNFYTSGDTQTFSDLLLNLAGYNTVCQKIVLS